jgi:predicted ATPase
MAMHKEVNEIRKKMLNSPWPKYLRSVQIDGLRGWTGQEIRFEFPVTVICGENGSGKSTVLKTAAAAYAHPSDRSLTFYPGTFFPDTAWETISGVTLSYKVREGTKERAYSARKLTERWRQSERPSRNVILQDISRTLPIDATVGYARIARKKATETKASALSSELTGFYSAMLGRIYENVRLAHSNLDATRIVGVVRFGGQQYSQFHQGAGEDATLDLIQILKDIPDTSLVIIDEVEASLHPRSQRRLIHFLLWLARTKMIQVLLSTHSGNVLEELPPEARIFIQRGVGGVEILYGISPNYALNRMDDLDRPDLYLFTEDREATLLVSELLRQAGVELGRIRCLEAGPANMVETLGRLAEEKRLPVTSIGVLDGERTETLGCVKLPGTCPPEIQLFNDLLSDGIATLAQRLDMSTSSVEDALRQSATDSDHHGWIRKAGRLLNQTPSYLWDTMCKVWVKQNLSNPEALKLINRVRAALN